MNGKLLAGAGVAAYIWYATAEANGGGIDTSNGGSGSSEGWPRLDGGLFESIADSSVPIFRDDGDDNAASESPGDTTTVNTTMGGTQERRVVADESGDVWSPDSEDAANEGGTVAGAPATADQGESANWGAVEEAEDDDLNERSATSNLSDDEKDAFDRLANIDVDDSDSSSTYDGGTTTTTTSDGEWAVDMGDY